MAKENNRQDRLRIKILWPANLLLLGMSLILFLIIAEGGSKLFFHYRPIAPFAILVAPGDFTRTAKASQSPNLAFVGIPFEAFVDNGIYYAYNSQGLRDHEYGPKKGGVYRILVLGDSVTWGVGVAFNDTYVKKLEKKLKENQAITYEVINAATGGYNTIQELLWFKEYGFAYQPDLIIIAFTGADEQPTLLVPKGDRLEQLTLITSDVPTFALLPGGYHQTFLTTSSFYQLFTQSLYSLLSQAIPESSFYYYNEGRDTTKLAIRDFASLVSDKEMKLAFLLIPPLVKSSDNRHSAWLADFLETQNIPSLDLFSIFQQSHPESFQLNEQDKTHPNAIGHSLIANQTYVFLRENKLI